MDIVLTVRLAAQFNVAGCVTLMKQLLSTTSRFRAGGAEVVVVTLIIMGSILFPKVMTTATVLMTQTTT